MISIRGGWTRVNGFGIFDSRRRIAMLVTMVPVKITTTALLSATLLIGCLSRNPEPLIPADVTIPDSLPQGDAKPLGLLVVTVDTLRADYLS